jgi:CCR4-NOT transcription complex subunit 2
VRIVLSCLTLDLSTLNFIQLPMCYYMQPPALKTGHLSKFQLETLFYIFYALPKDVLQAYAAQELYTREWRYHVESKLWFKRATPSETGMVSGNGLSSAGQFIYFDINTWERRMYGNVNQNIAGGFLPEDDVRVKFPSS